MRILLVHNYYQQPGGEDTAYERERDLLRAKGHEVFTYERTNSEIRQIGALGRVALPINSIWSSRAYDHIRKQLKAEKPEIVHFHNTHFMISPSAYYACTAEGVPVVQSLDNPRLICPAASLFRDGHLCEDCLNKTPPWPGVLHACYRNSRLQTAAVAGMLTSHRLLSTWQEQVNLYLVATHFYRQKFIQAGLPPERLALKPHFVTPDPQVRTITPGDYALFIGRLDPEKGIPTLLEAWKQLSGIPLRIRGGGQLLEAVQASAASNSAIQVLDRLGDLELTELIKGARFLVWPSEGYYETFGFVAAEAFACGVPVIASDIGVTGEMVEDGVNGLLFEPGNAADLIEKVTWAWAHPQETVRMGRTARRRYEEKFSPLPNYHLLIDLYQRVIEAR